MDLLDALRGEEDELWSAPRLLRADVLEAARSLSPQEARYLVDAYYSLQHYRIQAHNQALALTERTEPSRLTVWFEQRYRQLEAQIQRVLDAYSQTQALGLWARAQIGIGPVLASGLLAHLNPEPPPTVGHWWSFAGLNPAQSWEKSTKRPWNAKLKVIAWKCGQSFVKCSGREDCLYGQLYKQRKAYEQARNLQGLYADQAARMLAIKKIDPTTEAYKHYDDGHLPPGHIQARSERWAVKLFLSHYWLIAYFDHYQTMPPKPFALEHRGHTDFIWPRHTEMIPGLTEALRQVYGR